MNLSSSRAESRKLKPPQNMMAPTKHNQTQKPGRSRACVARRQRMSTHMATQQVAMQNSSDTSRDNSQSKPSRCISPLAMSMLMYQIVMAIGITMNGRRQRHSMTTPMASGASSSVIQRQVIPV